MPDPRQTPIAPIVLATGNPHKVEEMRVLFARYAPDPTLAIPIRSLTEAMPDHAEPAEPAETGSTFEQNAGIKALAYADQTGSVCLADDSGLEIDALAGAPGVISSHYCSDGREEGLARAERDARNNQLVLERLKGVPSAQRSARFVCVMALAVPPGWKPSSTMPAAPPYHELDPLWTLRERLDRIAREPDRPHLLLTARGEFKGRIGIPPRVPSGRHGFGYDPLFLVGPDHQITAAELDPSEKNRRSHRAAAANQMLDLMIRSGLIPAPPTH